jgi:hypothetical protein
MSDEEPSLRYRDPVDARGFVILSGAVLVDRELSDGAKVTYLLLLDYARQEGACWPGQATLAAERGIKERAIRNHLVELEKRGLISIEQRGLRKTNVYWIENVQRVYGQQERKRPFDRQKNAGLDRQNFAGQDRQKNADKEDAVGNIHRRKTETLNVRREEGKEQPEERSTSNEGGVGIYAVRDRAVAEVVTLTRDEQSRRRFVQLWEVAERENVLDAWRAALGSLKRRLGGKTELARPGAYFAKACLQELEKRGVFVPTSAERSAEAGVATQIVLSLESAEVPALGPAEAKSPILPEKAARIAGVSHVPEKGPEPPQQVAEGPYGGIWEESPEFEVFVATEREKYIGELAGASERTRERLLVAFDRPEKRLELLRRFTAQTR